MGRDDVEGPDTAVSVRKSIKMADKFVKKCFLLQKNKLRPVEHASQSSCSRTTAIEICTGVSASSPLCLPQVMV